MDIKKYSLEDGIEIGSELGITFDRFDAGQFADGINIELVNCGKTPGTDVSKDDLLEAGRVALAHLNDEPEYYVLMHRKEMEAKGYYNKQ